MASLQEECEGLREEAARLHAETAEWQAKYEAMAGRMEEERAGKEALETLVEEQRTRLEALEAESAEWRMIEEEMKEMYARLEEVEELKRTYERRIKGLRVRLRAAGTPDDEYTELIDMQADPPRPPQPNPPAEDDTRWLRTLPKDL